MIRLVKHIFEISTRIFVKKKKKKLRKCTIFVLSLLLELIFRIGTIFVEFFNIW